MLYVVLEGEVAREQQVELFLGVADGKHGEVVALSEGANEGAYGFCHGGDDGQRGICVHLLQHLLHPFRPELGMHGVFGFRQAVGIEEHGASRTDKQFLGNVLIAGQDAERKVGKAWYGGRLFLLCGRCYEQWGAVARVAVAQTACREVEYAEEHSDEHVGVVGLCHRVVHLCHDAFGA